MSRNFYGGSMHIPLFRAWLEEVRQSQTQCTLSADYTIKATRWLDCIGMFELLVLKADIPILSARISNYDEDTHCSDRDVYWLYIMTPFRINVKLDLALTEHQLSDMLIIFANLSQLSGEWKRMEYSHVLDNGYDGIIFADHSIRILHASELRFAGNGVQGAVSFQGPDRLFVECITDTPPGYVFASQLQKHVAAEQQIADDMDNRPSGRTPTITPRVTHIYTSLDDIYPPETRNRPQDGRWVFAIPLNMSLNPPVFIDTLCSYMSTHNEMKRWIFSVFCNHDEFDNILLDMTGYEEYAVFTHMNLMALGLDEWAFTLKNANSECRGTLHFVGDDVATVMLTYHSDVTHGSWKGERTYSCTTVQDLQARLAHFALVETEAGPSGQTLQDCKRTKR